MPKKTSKTTVKSTPKIEFAPSVHVEYPAETVKKLTQETMEHLVKTGDKNLAKWGYAVMKVKVEDFWKKVGNEVLNKTRQDLKQAKYYPSLQRKKKQAIQEQINKRTIRISEDEIMQRLSDNKLLKKRPMIISTPK